MKTTVALLACVLASTLAAAAQEDLNFASLPPVGSPTLMPNGYGGLNWSGDLALYDLQMYLLGGRRPRLADQPFE